MTIEEEQTGKPGRPASEPSETVRVKERDARERAQQILEEDERAAQQARDRDPAQLARYFIARKLFFRAFIGHDGIFTKRDGYDPKTTDADAAWLMNLPFLHDSPYLQPLIAHTEIDAHKSTVEGKRIFPVEDLAPYRPNVLTPLISSCTEVLLDHDDWIGQRIKENGESTNPIPTSKFRYGHLIEARVGTATYQQICHFYLESVREIARRKRIGGLIQEVENKQPMEISPTILVQLTDYGETFEDAVSAYCESLRLESIIPRPHYEFMYAIGELILAIIGSDAQHCNTIGSKDLQALTQKCLAIIPESG